ncbi:hypothetical protein GWK63_07655 [Komagataeibacter rhaeticus]|uniref:Uncharacterized protein n=4 Tax=Komagataeibacter rhaeticus TaxID=215221 RepID=A0A858JMS5_9PROT|nr:hypothetical protein GWK63_07655 [Komagataeibacter rhaeticus]QOC48154.1 hypothetical protein ICJ78_07715 [Komagataeibacter rhaeticus]
MSLELQPNATAPGAVFLWEPSMHIPTRRAFLRGSSALVAAAALAACTASRSGTTTTITLNVAEVADYVDALLNFSSTAINMPLVAAAMGAPNVALANTVIAALTTAGKAFVAAAGSSTSVSYDSASVKAAFDSILTDTGQVNTLIIATITGMAADLSGSVVTQAKTAAGAAATLIDLLKAMVAVSGRHAAGARLVADGGINMQGMVAMNQIGAFVSAQGG